MKLCGHHLLCTLALLFLPVASYCEDGRTIAVKGAIGQGTNRQFALADAYRNAISQALGTYVVTSRKWDGETLDKKIFDNSDAIVIKHRVVDEGEIGGRYSITIDAEIVQNEMMKYVRKETSTVVEEGELANLLAKRNATNNAIKSLELLFQNWRENVYRIEKYGNLSISAEDDVSSDNVLVSVPFIVTFRWDAYHILLEKLRNVLSRIAVGKTEGVYSDKSGYGTFAAMNFPFYSSVGLARKDSGYQNDIKFQNPNCYGEVRIVSRLYEGYEAPVKYEIYIVPNQVKKAIDSFLQRQAEIRFTFTSKGGKVIAKHSVFGCVYFFGWESLYNCGVLYNGYVNLGRPDSGYSERITIADKIKTELDGNHWAEQRLYHGLVSVPLNEASLIAGCVISACQAEGSRNYYGSRSISSELMSKNEWIKINKTPKTPTINKTPTITAKGKSSPRATAADERSTRVKQIPVSASEETTGLSENDKKLKGKIEELLRLPPSFSAAASWSTIAEDIESKELRQMVLKVAGSAFIYARRRDIYDSMIKPQIHDASSFEELFLINCPVCMGKKTVNGKCSACSGSGVCKYSNCKDGMHLVKQFMGSYYRKCSGCRGTGRCRKCGGTGNTNSDCQSCQRKGKVSSSEPAAKMYDNYRKKISEVLR